MSDSVQLFRVVIKVRPTPAHPIYFEWECGHLILWLYSEAEHDASERAKQIVEQLPYEVLGNETGIYQAEPGNRPSELFIRHQEIAKRSGFSLCLVAMETGRCDVGEFIRQPFP